MRTRGHREGSITHWGLLGGLGEGEWQVGGWGGIILGEIPKADDKRDGCSKQPWHVYTYVTILSDLHMYLRT